MASTNSSTDVHLPRVAITFCTQCKWMLRAAYFGQELLSTFGTSIGEIALIPATGGLFEVKLTYRQPGTNGEVGAGEVAEVLIWDRKTEGGFPETKILKQLVRNRIEPGKGLGHSDGSANRLGGGGKGKDDVANDPLVQDAAEAAAGNNGGVSEPMNNSAIAPPTPPKPIINPSAPVEPLLQDAAKVDPTPPSCGPTTATADLPLLNTTLHTNTAADPLLETAVTSPISGRKRGESQPMSPFAQDAYATANANFVVEEEGDVVVQRDGKAAGSK